MIIANWAKQYFLTVTTDYGSATGSGWYDEGSVAKVSINDEILTQGLTRNVFLGWSEDYGNEKEISVTVDSPKLVHSIWKTQHYLTLITDYGSAIGSGWYDEGKRANFVVESTSVSVEGLLGILGVKQIYDGWIDEVTGESYKGTLIVSMPKTLTAQWKTDFTNLHISVGVIVAILLVISVFIRYRPKPHRKIDKELETIL